mgnify:CR=1 FL=1
MKKDVLTPADIETVMALFYKKVKSDKILGIIFTEKIQINWSKHLPAMCSFWEKVIFYTGDYEGDPLTIHKRLYQRFQTTPLHFKRWLKLFNQSIDELFEGENAQKMKDHAAGIARVMQQRIDDGSYSAT